MGGEVDEDGEEEEPSVGDLIMHFISLFWKVLFSLVPPRFVDKLDDLISYFIFDGFS